MAAAWEFMKNLPQGHPLGLVVINPGYVLGPLPDTHQRTSGELVQQLIVDLFATGKDGIELVGERLARCRHSPAKTRGKLLFERGFLRLQLFHRTVETEN